MQVCTSLQTDNHASTPPLCFLQAERPSCRPTNSVKALKANTATQQRKHKYKKAKTTTQSITVVDTLYWSINKISYYYHLCSPNLIAYVSHIDTKLAKTIHRGNVSKYKLILPSFKITARQVNSKVALTIFYYINTPG